jgi:hypothetical protein
LNLGEIIYNYKNILSFILYIMSVMNDISKMLKNQRGLICLGVLAIVVAFSLYSNRLGSTVSPMKNPLENDQYAGETAPAVSEVNPAMPAGMNSGPGAADGVRTVTSGVPTTCLNKQVANPGDLLPKDNNSSWAAANPRGAGDLSNINLLKAGELTGVDTVGSTLRNANLQVRSEPPNPQIQVSPWANTTIQPDLMRIPLELGCGPQ